MAVAALPSSPSMLMARGLSLSVDPPPCRCDEDEDDEVPAEGRGGVCCAADAATGATRVEWWGAESRYCN